MVALQPRGLLKGQQRAPDHLAAVQTDRLGIQLPHQLQAPVLRASYQLLQRCPQGRRQFGQRPHGGVGLSTLDLTQHAAGYAGLRRSPLDAHLPRPANALDILSHRLLNLHSSPLIAQYIV